MIEKYFIIDGGAIFYGTLDQFKNCFFSNANEWMIREWCDERGYSLIVSPKIHKIFPDNELDNLLKWFCNLSKETRLLINQISNEKIKPNSKCFCGSGRKFKVCCGIK